MIDFTDISPIPNIILCKLVFIAIYIIFAIYSNPNRKDHKD